MSRAEIMSRNKIMKSLTHMLNKKARPTKNNQFSFLYEPSQTPIAVTTGTNSLTLDAAQARLSDKRTWPDGFPAEKQKDGKAVRIHYKSTNTVQCELELENILVMYRTHIKDRNSRVSETHPFLEEYLEKNPVGAIELDINDANLFKNASKLVEQAATSATPSSAIATSATTDSTATDPAKKSKKKGKKAKASDDPDTTSPMAEGGKPVDLTGQIPPVKTAFALQLARIQKELYVLLRGNIELYIDSSCWSVVSNEILTFERNRGLKDTARLDPSKRFTWAQIKQTLLDKCCIQATGGFFFLPLFPRPTKVQRCS